MPILIRIHYLHQVDFVPKHNSSLDLAFVESLLVFELVLLVRLLIIDPLDSYDLLLSIEHVASS